jgi:APA family basic amino acid/polyamine antiporter
VAVACIAGCVYLFLSGLPRFTQVWFVFWNTIGLVVYLLYGMRKSRLATAI